MQGQQSSLKDSVRWLQIQISSSDLVNPSSFSLLFLNRRRKCHLTYISLPVRASFWNLLHHNLAHITNLFHAGPSFSVRGVDSWATGLCYHFWLWILNSYSSFLPACVIKFLAFYFMLDSVYAFLSINQSNDPVVIQNVYPYVFLLLHSLCSVENGICIWLTSQFRIPLLIT